MYAIIKTKEKKSGTRKTKFTSDIKSKLTNQTKNLGNTIHIEEKNQSIKTDPAMTKMIE